MAELMLFTAEVECLLIGLAAAGKVLRLGGCGGQIEPGVGSAFLFGDEAEVADGLGAVSPVQMGVA